MSKRLSPFDFVRSINEKTENLMRVQPETEKDYLPFMVNRSLSFSQDAVLPANAMNTNWFLDKRMQYDFLYGSVRRRKRFDKWQKREIEDESLVKSVMELYSIGQRRAIEYISMMTPNQREEIRKGYGGA
jgi:hypothetical protein